MSTITPSAFAVAVAVEVAVAFEAYGCIGSNARRVAVPKSDARFGTLGGNHNTLVIVAIGGRVFFDFNGVRFLVAGDIFKTVNR